MVMVMVSDGKFMVMVSFGQLIYFAREKRSFLNINCEIKHVGPSDWIHLAHCYYKPRMQAGIL